MVWLLLRFLGSELSSGQLISSSSTPETHAKTMQPIECAAASVSLASKSRACRCDGEGVDPHLRLKAERKLGIAEVPVLLCDEWTPAHVKAFRLMVNRSVSWAAWDEELLSLRLLDLNSADFDLSLTGFDPGEIDGWSHMPDEERANAAPPLPDHPASRTGDLWLCGNLRRRNSCRGRGATAARQQLTM